MYNAINTVVAQSGGASDRSIRSFQMHFDGMYVSQNYKKSDFQPTINISNWICNLAHFFFIICFVEIKLLWFTNLFTKRIVVTSCKRTWSKTQNNVILPYLTKYFSSKYISMLINILMYNLSCKAKSFHHYHECTSHMYFAQI